MLKLRVYYEVMVSIRTNDVYSTRTTTIETDGIKSIKEIKQMVLEKVNVQFRYLATVDDIKMLKAF